MTADGMKKRACAMIIISLCMIEKNEEYTLARCLDSLRGVVDETVIVDTGSTDRTKEIAGTFSRRRGITLNSKATMDYILWLDAGERSTGRYELRIAASSAFRRHFSNIRSQHTWSV